MTDQAQDLDQLISLSRTMLEKAREESWDDVVILEAKRNELIKLFFIEPIEPTNADTVAGGIQSMISINTDIIALGELKRFDLTQALQNLDQGKKAVKAYTS
jgi:hypothetical protein